jgi:hypothetical protein
MFDVIFAYPDAAKWRTIDDYPVVIATGDIELTEAEGKRLAQYVEQGGTLLAADTHLTGPGAALIGLPKVGDAAEAAGYRWLTDETVHPSQRYRYREIKSFDADERHPSTPWRTLATTSDGKVICGSVDRGKGRLIYLSVPRGLGIDRALHPAVARLIAHLTRGLMPIEVDGDVNWLVNRGDKTWLVTLLNPHGQDKPQQGITPTDYRQNRTVTIRSRVPVAAARDWLMPDDSLVVKEGAVTLTVPAGSARIIELRPSP